MAAITSNSGASAAKVLDFKFDSKRRALSYTFRDPEDLRVFNKELFDKCDAIELSILSDLDDADSNIVCELIFPESQADQYKLRSSFVRAMEKVSKEAMNFFKRFTVEEAPALSLERLQPPERSCLLPFSCGLNRDPVSPETLDNSLRRFARSSIFEPRVMSIVSEFL